MIELIKTAKSNSFKIKGNLICRARGFNGGANGAKLKSLSNRSQNDLRQPDSSPIHSDTLIPSIHQSYKAPCLRSSK